ncbi:MAG TPA: hypothetical protein VHG70_10535 [Nocardioidaceae bacterium]|nr:hypothetical protein [Nocardioidaceae bacterium]
MMNVVAVQAEIEYRQARLLQEAAEERRARPAGSRAPGRARRFGVPRVRARRSSARPA